MTTSWFVYRRTAARLSAICLPAGFRRETARSQTVPNKASFTGFISEKEWCRGAELNFRHHDFQSALHAIRCNSLQLHETLDGSLVLEL